jgi:EAL domain-containing protein (putative c-di-GMP-specific phosphodiesterase class I)
VTIDHDRSRFDYLRLRSALIDRITGLPALPLLFDEMRAMLDRRKTVGVLHIASSNLPLVESVYGWRTFDRVVGRQAEELERQIGGALPAGSRLAQMGIHGSELIAIVPECPDGGAVNTPYLQARARELEAAMRTIFEAEEFATLSPRMDPQVGYAFLSENPYFRFERLVYRAIEDARSQPAARHDRMRRSWGGEIQQVIRDGGIRIHFQPVVDLTNLRVIGYEALSRGPEGSGLESPAVMFELSREAGIAAELDRLCRRLALDAARGIGRGRKIFLNTRAELLADPEWRDGEMEERLARLELAPSDVVVEIPEPSAADDDGALAERVRGLKQRGFLIALDDIGTGYSGIGSIDRLRPDFLKIDISLVRRIDASLIQQDVLSSLVSIGGRAGAEVIAEGIETARELDYLRSHGARYGQGFLFSAAVPTMLPGPFAVEREH